MDVPQARVAVIDGTAHAPGQPWKRGSQIIKTLWEELAWRLGGAEAFTPVAEADATGTSPGKDVCNNHKIRIARYRQSRRLRSLMQS
jgi:predicted AAA+ superfamily ATPase